MRAQLLQLCSHAAAICDAVYVDSILLGSGSADSRSPRYASTAA